jgi:hypothetical protein
MICSTVTEKVMVCQDCHFVTSSPYCFPSVNQKRFLVRGNNENYLLFSIVSAVHKRKI